MRRMTLILLMVAVLAFAVTQAAAVEVGDHFYFGTFEQDVFSVDGEEPIIWRVLDVDGDRVLALSEFGLYTHKYHRNNNKTAWGDTDVRDWLNTTFLASFTGEEMAQIFETKVSGSLDRVFLLDEGQVSRYLRSPYLCYATPWALIHGEEGAYVNEDTGASSWLVRTDTAYKRIAWVGGGGKLYSPTGKKGVNYLTSSDNVVRPAIWVRAEATTRRAERYGFPLYAKSNQRISTRSGPSTGYNGLGDYFSGGGELVRVLSRVHDGNIWWLQVEFEYKGALVRCYTGLKRINVNISRVSDEPGGILGRGTVARSTEAFYGPGTWYKKQVEKYTPTVGTTGDILARENGWVCLEYESPKERIRVWLPADAVEEF